MKLYRASLCLLLLAAAHVTAERGPQAPLRLEYGFDPFVPTLRKWYVPQELYPFYHWGGYKYTNYARESYRRYISYALDGTNRYDIFGNYLLRGWRVYEWRQEQNRLFGSSILKSDRFRPWFNNLVVASDALGQYHMSLAVGNEIRTSLTPLTFNKARFNGVQWDFASDRLAVTVLLSRTSQPVTPLFSSDFVQLTEYANFIGLRGQAQFNGATRLGATIVNSHLARSASGLAGAPFTGVLLDRQNSESVREVLVRIADDLPGDGRGAVYFSSRMWIDGRLSPVRPFVEGGRQRGALLEAIDGEAILVRFRVPDPAAVRRLGFDLVLADDYRVEVASNLQTDDRDQLVFLPVARAAGNVGDHTNRRALHFEYGLPSGNQIVGFDLKVENLLGWELRGELAHNTRFLRFPNVAETRRHKQHLSRRGANAWYLDLRHRGSRLAWSGEAFGIDHDYTTRGFIPDQNGRVNYANAERNWFEYIDDDDDHDGEVDWVRFEDNLSPGFADHAVIPGFDENNDRISDFDENANSLPDYEEPFWQHYVDPPDFMFGVDMNNNTVIDRLENDREADYPYKKGHWGYNIHLAIDMYPHVSLRLGQAREWLPAGAERSRMHYALISGLFDHGRWGQLEVFDMLKRVEDDIADDLLLWKQLPGEKGGLQPFADPLIMRDALVNESYIAHALLRDQFSMRHKLRFDYFNQLGDWEDSLFIGLVNKIDYRYRVRPGLVLVPRWKSIWRRRTRSAPGRAEQSELQEIISLSAALSLLKRSRVEVGMEVKLFCNFEPLPAAPPADYIDDFLRRTYSLQYTQRHDYQGYELTTNIGGELRDTDFVHLRERDVANVRAFVEVIVGTATERMGGRPAVQRGL